MTTGYRWDARLLLAGFFVVNSVALATDAVGLLLLALLLAPTFLTGRRAELLPRPSRRRALVLFVVLGLTILLGHGLELDGINRKGLIEGLTVCLRLYVLYGAAAALSRLVAGLEVAHALRWVIRFIHPGLADRLFHMTLLVFRFLPRLWEIADETRSVASLRCRSRFQSLRGTALAVITRFATEADRVAWAAQARGYFSWSPDYRFQGTRRSLVLLSICIAYCAVVLLADSGAT